MSLEGPFRVHIAPQGYEDERIYKPAIELDADQVVLLTHTESTELGESFQKKVEEKLIEEEIEIEHRDCDIFDPQASVRQIIEVINEFENDSVRFNISTGSKITAVTGFMACMVTGATPYYVKADNYGNEPVSKEVSDWIPLPSLPVDQLETQYIQILRYIQKEEEGGNDVSLGNISDFAVRNDLECVADADRDEDSDYYDLIHPVVETLAKRDLIKIDRRGNTKLLRITDDGKSAVLMFENTIPELWEPDK